MSASLTLRPSLYEELVPGGGHTSFVLKRGQVLRITDLEGDANVSLLLLSAAEKSERLNLPDTLKCQHTAKLTAGHCLYSDMGRVLAAITADTCGWHDSFGGVLNAEEVREKYGAGRYQELRNGYFRNGVDNLLVEMGKWNLNLQDLLMALNLFSKVTVDSHGAFHFEPGNSRAGGAHRPATPHGPEPRVRAQAGATELERGGERRHQRALPHLAPGERPRLP
jgi:urea carboxylase-associated protein 2